MKTASSIEDDVTLSLKTAVKHALVKKFSQGNDRPCDENDFLETRKNNVKLTNDIKLMIESLVNDIFLNKSTNETESSCHYSDFDNELLVLILILFGQNHTIQFWNTSEIVENCSLMLSHILKLFNCKNPHELISRNCRVNLTKNILLRLSTDLTKLEWKNFPASVVCYKWILKMIQQPELSQHLQFVLPPALLLIDDFVTENQIIGAQCLDHIIQNVTIAELQLCGHGEIMYAALLPLLRVREASLVQSIVPPLVSLTTKLEFDLGKKELTKWSKFDKILEIYLENMELEQIIDLRSCYISNLNSLIRAVGYNVIRWTKKLLRIFDEYMQTAGKYQDEKTIQNCVEVIETYIQLSKGETFLYSKHLLFTLLMGLQFTASCESINRINIENTILQSIKNLTQSFSKTEKEKIINDLQKNVPCSKNFVKFHQKLDEVFQTNI